MQQTFRMAQSRCKILVGRGGVLGKYVQLHVHLVWATSERMPLITETLEPEIFAVIGQRCLALSCAAIAIGGTADHVHVLARLHPSVAVARLVAEIKGALSHVMNGRLGEGDRFGWQRGYAAFTIGSDDVPAVTRYVLDQKRHHATSSTQSRLELGDDER